MQLIKVKRVLLNWKRNYNWFYRRTITVVTVIAAGVTLCLTGCTTMVGGRTRPLVKVDDIRGSLEYSMDYQSDERGSSGFTTQSDSTLMEELLNLQVKGDVYDPKLMTYTALAGFGLSQQEYDSPTRSGSDDGDLLRYGFSANFLPTKLYPFSIEAVKTESLIPRAFQSPLHVDDSHEGFNLRLRIPDWPMSFSWSQSDLVQDSDIGDTDDAFDRTTERFSYTLTHDFSEFSHMTFRSDIDNIKQTTSIFNSDVKTQRHRFEHDYIFGDAKQHRLDTTLSYLERQDLFDSKTFDWSENLVLRHSDDFSTFYNIIFSDSTVDEIDVQTLSGIAGFVHQLYSNLTTQAEVLAVQSKFGSINETESQGGRINFDYFRNNPWGILFAELEFDLRKDENSGQSGTAAVVNESHVFNDPFPFTLDQQNIDPASIVITDITGTLLYTEGDDYTIAEVGNQIEITCTTLGMNFPNISNGQTLLVDYLYEIIGDLEEDTFGRRFRIEQQFNNGLSVYFSNRLLDRDVDSDIDPDFIADDTETNLYGLEYKFKRMTFVGEHLKTESTFQTSESDRLAVSGSWPLTPKTSLWVSVSNTWIDTTGDGASRDATLFRAESKIRSRLTRYLRLSGRVEYRNEDDSELGQTNGYRVGSSLDYDRGLVRVRAGWDTYFLERRNTESDSTRFYLDLTRFF